MGFELSTTHKGIPLETGYWRINGFAWHLDGGERVEISLALFASEDVSTQTDAQELAAIGIRGPDLNTIMALLEKDERDYRTAIYRWLKQRDPGEDTRDPDFRNANDADQGMP